MLATSNLFVLHASDPGLVAEAGSSLLASNDFGGDVRRSGSEWIAATCRLPDESPDRAHRAPDIPPVDSPDSAHGKPDSPLLLVAEGFEALDEHARKWGAKGWDAIARLALDTPEKLCILPGDFTFIAVDPGSRGTSARAVAVRSCGGGAPLHIYEGSHKGVHVIAIATRVADLVRFTPVPLAPDPLTWAAVATGCTAMPDGRSFVAGSRLVPRGHAAVIEPGRTTRTTCYFDPRPDRWPELTAAHNAEHVERLRELLLDTLRNHLDPNGGNLLALSGGVDSAALGAIAAGELGLGVSTFSLLPPKGEPNEPHERHFIEHLAKKVGFTRQFTVGFTLERLIEGLGAAPDVAFPLPTPTFCALPQLMEETDVRVVYSGEHADEVCGSYVTLPDWAVATTLPTLLRNIRSLPTGMADIARWIAWRLLWVARRPRIYIPAELSAIVAPAIRDEYTEWYRRYQRAGAPPGPWRFLAMWHNSNWWWVGAGWEAATRLGVRRSLPFLTREMLELVYDCHPTELVGPGPKKLLRRAVHDLVPAENLYRPDKGTNIVPLPPGSGYAWTRPMPEVIRPILDSRWQESSGWVSFPEIFSLAMLERAGRSFEMFAGGY